MIFLFTDQWMDIPREWKFVKNELALCGKLIIRGDRIVVPEKLRKRVVEVAHLAHQGATAMKAQLRSKVWFPGMDQLISEEMQRMHDDECCGPTMSNGPACTDYAVDRFGARFQRRFAT